jgi:hypothetical protein
MKKIGIRAQYFVFLSALSIVVIIFIVIVINKDKVISQLRSDLVKSQMVTVLQHNDNEKLQARLTDLEEKSGGKK